MKAVRINSINLLFCLSLLISGKLVFAATEFKDDYSQKVLKESILFLCSDEDFTGKARIKHEECVKFLNKSGKTCSDLVKPLIPDVSEERLVLRERIKNVGTLYAMCLKTMVYDHFLSAH